MARPAGDQPPTAHPIYPDHIRLYLDRKKRGNGVIEAQFKAATGWSGFRVVGRSMPDAMKTSMEMWVRMQAGLQVEPQTAGRPKTSTKPDRKATDTFELAAMQVIADIRAEQAKHAAIVGSQSKTLEKYKKNLNIIRKPLIDYFGAMRCKDIDDDVAYKFQTSYRLTDGTRPSASTMGSIGALFRRVLKHAAGVGWRSRNHIPSLSKKGLPPAPRRPDVQPEDALRLLGYMSDEWCNDAKRETTRWDRILLRAFVAVAIVTGSRPGTELTELRWQHIRPPGLDYPHWLFSLNGKTDRREVSPDESLIEFGSALDAARKLNGGDPETLVFARPGGAIKHDNFMRFFADLVAELRIKPLQGSKPITLYSIRHYYATHLRRHGFADYEIAEVMGTSPKMIHEHYGHIQPLKTAKRIASISIPKQVMRNRLAVMDARMASTADKDATNDPDDHLTDEERANYGSRPFPA